MAGKTINPSSRRYDLDWLRITAVFLLVPFHSALIFSLNPNHVVYVKDHIESVGLVTFAGFLHPWHMPLLFAIAGAATWFALGSRTSYAYLKERFSRLLIPALFGLVILIPPMVYMQFVARGNAPDPVSAYLRFWTLNPNDLTGYQGQFTPAHLWFIIFLFIFSVLALPLFLFLRADMGKKIIGALAAAAEIPGVIYFWTIPLALASALPLLGDKNPLYYILIFISGYILISDPRFQRTIDSHMWVSFALGLLTFAATLVWPPERFAPWSPGYVGMGLVYNLTRWAWVLGFLGLGHVLFNVSNAVLRYCSDAAYPFYILHLPINTLVGFWVVQWPVDVTIKYFVIIVLTTVSTVAVYDVVVKRLNILRFLFGIKPLAGTSTPAPMSGKVVPQ